MKEGWTYKKLGEFIEEYSVRDKGQAYPVYSVTNTRGFCQEFFGKNVASEDTTNYKVVPRGCFAYNPSRINVGSVAWQNQEDNVSVSPLYVVFSVSPELRQDYLLYYIKSNYSMTYINALSRGAVRNNLRLSTLKSFDIPYASLSEQQHVVSELDLLSGVIEKHKAQLEELDKLAQSIFYDMFGDKEWEKKTLKNITSKMGSGATPRGGNQSYKSFGISLIRSLNVHNNKFIYENLAFIDDEQAKQLNSVTIEKGDVLLNITGASVARCCMVPDDVLPARVNQHVSIIRPLSIVNNVFLCHFFTNQDTQAILLNLSKNNAATREALPKSLLEKILVPLPPLSLQQEFAAKVEAIEAMKAKVRQSLKEAETLFNSRMDYYFN